MKLLPMFAIIFGFSLTMAAAQDATITPTPPTDLLPLTPTYQSQPQELVNPCGGYSKGPVGNDHVFGTVIAIDGDCYAVKDDEGETYTAYMPNGITCFKSCNQLKDEEEKNTWPCGRKPAINPKSSCKLSEIKVGDMIYALGASIDIDAMTFYPLIVMHFDTETSKEMHEKTRSMYGKTWLKGEVKSVDGMNVTLMGSEDHITHSIVTDKDTYFCRGFRPITFADVHAGNTVHVKGYVKNGSFLATTIEVIIEHGPPIGQRGLIPPPPD
jgi:hypothetical protein